MNYNDLTTIIVNYHQQQIAEFVRTLSLIQITESSITLNLDSWKDSFNKNKSIKTKLNPFLNQLITNVTLEQDLVFFKKYNNPQQYEIDHTNVNTFGPRSSLIIFPLFQIMAMAHFKTSTSTIQQIKEIPTLELISEKLQNLPNYKITSHMDDTPTDSKQLRLNMLLNQIVTKYLTTCGVCAIGDTKNNFGKFPIFPTTKIFWRYGSQYLQLTKDTQYELIFGKFDTHLNWTTTHKLPLPIEQKKPNLVNLVHLIGLLCHDNLKEILKQVLTNTGQMWFELSFLSLLQNYSESMANRWEVNIYNDEPGNTILPGNSTIN